MSSRPLECDVRDGLLQGRNAFYSFELDPASGALRIDDLELLCGAGDVMPPGRGLSAQRISVANPTLVRALQTWDVDENLAVDVAYGFLQSPNVHVYVRIRVLSDVEMDALTAVRLQVLQSTLDDLRVARHSLDAHPIVLDGPDRSLGLAFSKLPTRARWNELGPYDASVLASLELRIASDPPSIVIRAEGVGALRAGETIESSLVARYGAEARREIENEASYDHPEENRYLAHTEFRRRRQWEGAELWYGPPVRAAAVHRPTDRLTPRPLGFDVEGGKWFSYNNEDFVLWRLTGKSHYWDAAIKKANALLATQNEYGGWFEGCEFYNLPPDHHQHYLTYMSASFLLEAFDHTGHEEFLEAARAASGLWLGEPPANGHVKVGDGWWYRWGGYVSAGYTDERLVLNTHVGTTALFAALVDRTGDERAREALARGVAAFKEGLRRGIQRESGQFLYALSQLDPTLQRPGDPPVLKFGLRPQVEDVYTVVSCFRLLLVNRIVGDGEIRDCVDRALRYWWQQLLGGATYGYQAYAMPTYGLAAGELDAGFARALPVISTDPAYLTVLARGLTPLVARAGFPGLVVTYPTTVSHSLETVFMRHDATTYEFAIVNRGSTLASLPVAVELPPGTSRVTGETVDPASGRVERTAVSLDEGTARFRVARLGERDVVVVRLGLDSEPTS